MFNDCKVMKKLNINNFKTDNVTNMIYMFNVFQSLKELNLCYFNTYKVNNFSHMFNCCESLNSLDLSNFSTKNLYYHNLAFNQKSSTNNHHNFNSIDEEIFSNMFFGCTSLEEIICSDQIINEFFEKSLKINNNIWK